jgi:hypothetical protein
MRTNPFSCRCQLLIEVFLEAAGDLAFDFTKNLPDFVFDSVHVATLLCEPAQVGKGFPVDEIVDEGVFLSHQLGLYCLVQFQVINVLQKQQSGGLLGVIQLGGAASLFPENIVDVSESLSEHGHHFL